MLLKPLGLLTSTENVVSESSYVWTRHLMPSQPIFGFGVGVRVDLSEVARVLEGCAGVQAAAAKAWPSPTGLPPPLFNALPSLFNYD